MHQNSAALLALCEGNPSVIGGFPWYMTSDAEIVSQMRALLATCRKPVGIITDCPKCYMFLNIKRYTIYSMPHKAALWYFDIAAIYPQDIVGSNLLQYLHVLYSTNVCELLLYNRQLVVITCQILYFVRPADLWGEIKSLWNRTFMGSVW